MKIGLISPISAPSASRVFLHRSFALEKREIPPSFNAYYTVSRFDQSRLARYIRKEYYSNISTSFGYFGEFTMFRTTPRVFVVIFEY